MDTANSPNVRPTRPPIGNRRCGSASSTGLSVAQAEALEALPTAVITKALHALERDTRMAVYYADVEGFSYKEIAHITNRSVSAVISVLRRGRHQMRNLLLAVPREPAAGPLLNDAPKNTAQAQRATSIHSPLRPLSEADTCAVDSTGLNVRSFASFWTGLRTASYGTRMSIPCLA